MVQENIDNLSDKSHKRVTVVCDSQISEKCYKTYNREWRLVRQTRKNNNQDICLPCSRRLKASGRNNPNTKYFSQNDHYFDHIDTPFKAWMLGWIASDGTLSQEGVIEISILTTDAYILEPMADELKCRRPHQVKKGYLTALTINSRHMATTLRTHLGMTCHGKKSFIVQFPELSDDLKPHFIRGLVEGDGCISTARKRYLRIEIASCSTKMKTTLFEIFECGYISKKGWEITGQKAFDIGKYIYENSDITPILIRKYNKYLEHLNKPKRKPYTRYKYNE